MGARKAWPRVPDRLPYMISSSLLLVFVVNILRNELPSGAISPVLTLVEDTFGGDFSRGVAWLGLYVDYRVVDHIVTALPI